MCGDLRLGDARQRNPQEKPNSEFPAGGKLLEQNQKIPKFSSPLKFISSLPGSLIFFPLWQNPETQLPSRGIQVLWLSWLTYQGGIRLFYPLGRSLPGAWCPPFSPIFTTVSAEPQDFLLPPSQKQPGIAQNFFLPHAACPAARGRLERGRIRPVCKSCPR